MNESAGPLERLTFFQEQLGITPEELAALDPHRGLFLARRDEFAQFMYDLLRDIPETRRIVDLMEARGGLRRNWRCWYEGLFTDGFSHGFQEFLWSSGTKHVARSVDQRFIHLAYCRARLFLGEIVDREIPEGERPRVRAVLDKLVDHCLLVATDAFLAGTTQCDREVINGIAHQVRNPLTVIGGFAHQLRRKVSEDSPVHPVVGTMLQEIARLESMVGNVGSFIEIMQRPTEFTGCLLGPVLETVVGRLRAEGWAAGVDLEVGDLPEQRLDSDVHLLELLFHQLLKNALEASREAAEPRVRVSGGADGSPPHVLSVVIQNNGRVPPAEEVPHLFTPFFSSHPSRSGFGLPIAGLIVRKIRGEIDLVALPGEGVRTEVILPARVG